MRIAVVGAGVAGLATATLLARNGHAVTLFERQAGLPAVGGGLLIQPCGLQVLARLGLQDEILRSGSPITRILRQRAGGEITVRLDYQEYRPGSHALGILRGALAAAMLKLATRTGVEVRFGCGINAMRETDDAALLEGTSVQTVPFSAVIVADGMRSALRASLGLACEIADCEWGVLSVAAPRPAAMADGLVRQWFRRGPDVIGVLPSGRDQQGRDWVTWFQNMTVARFDALDRSNYSRWRDEAIAVSPESRELLRSLPGFEAFQFSRFSTVTMPRWSTRRCVVIGDAAHALDPLLGMGANMALVDAAVLADLLSRAPDSSMAATLRDFQARRTPQISRYQRASRVLGPLMRADEVMAKGLPDLAIRAALWTPGGRRRVMAAVCGD